MKRELHDILCCPVCKGKLELQVTEVDKQEIVSGLLICHSCVARYPIEDGIPNLLPHNM
ncbi:MAG: methytransferase partner Trm112 [Euryarchaeota archaeon]|nr:methytransferase partner Trm112 [Euryarchaeota archaeon]